MAPRKVAIYARVSRPEQILDNQLLVIQRLIDAHPDWEVVGTYTDKASGANQNRPGLDLLMADARAHKFNLIIATKIDRMARSVTNLSKLCNTLDGLGVGLKFAEQDIDTTTPEGRMLRTVLAAIAEFELELIHSRVKDGMDRARAEGKVIGRPSAELSQYQIDKAREIIQANPDISQRQLSEQFRGIGRQQLIRCLRKEGIWTK